MTHRLRGLPRISLLFVAASVVICGSSALAAVAISISPASVSLQVGQSQQFTAVVSGLNNTQLRWLVNGMVGGDPTVGTVSSSGLYAAPTAVPSGTIIVTVQSKQSPASASASVVVTTLPAITISISPSSASLQVGQSQQFTAMVSNTPNTAVNWLVSGVLAGNASLGRISSTGLTRRQKSLQW